MEKRTVIIGLDGVPFGLLKDLSEKGVMPNTKELLSGGTFRKMRSSIPEVSSVAWSSIITGKNPGEHGIFGFTDLWPNSYELRFPNFRDLKSLPFWRANENESVIINVPSTYPVSAMEGVHISGFVSIELEKSVYPNSLVPKLRDLDYRLDVNSQLAHKSLDLFLEDLDKTLTSRINTYKHLWRFIDWKTFMLVFTGTDRLMHFLWEAYEDQNHKYHGHFLEYFKKIDMAIGEINNNLKNGDALIMLSDHGFERLDKDVYINCALRQQGFLNFKSNSELSLDNLDNSTKAFSLDPARIYINLKGKYPKAGVKPEDRDKVANDLVSFFDSLTVDGKKVIKKIYKKEEIYSGPCLDKAPDLILMGNKNFNLKSSLNFSGLTSKGPFTGKHTYEDAFLFINNSSLANNLPQEPDVFCLADLFSPSSVVKS